MFLILLSVLSFASGKTYVHHLFVNENACKEARQKMDGWFNCSQSMTLNEDGTGRVIMTDIMNQAVYKVDGDLLTVEPVGYADFSKMVLKMDSNQRNLVELPDLKVWELVQDGQDNE